MGMVRSYSELDVYKKAIDAAMEIFQITKQFPAEERYSLTDQIRKSSRSVCANIAEAWRKRRYKAAFVSKLSDSESEAAETQVWLELCLRCGSLDSNVAQQLKDTYDHIIGKIVRMIDEAPRWTIHD